MTAQDRDETKLPPRAKVHPSYRGKWTKRFYGTLVALFTILILGLIGWFYLKSM